MPALPKPQVGARMDGLLQELSLLKSEVRASLLSEVSSHEAHSQLGGLKVACVLAVRAVALPSQIKEAEEGEQVVFFSKAQEAEFARTQIAMKGFVGVGDLQLLHLTPRLLLLDQDQKVKIESAINKAKSLLLNTLLEESDKDRRRGEEKKRLAREQQLKLQQQRLQRQSSICPEPGVLTTSLAAPPLLMVSDIVSAFSASTALADPEDGQAAAGGGGAESEWTTVGGARAKPLSGLLEETQAGARAGAVTEAAGSASVPAPTSASAPAPAPAPVRKQPDFALPTPRGQFQRPKQAQPVHIRGEEEERESILETIRYRLNVKSGREVHAAQARHQPVIVILLCQALKFADGFSRNARRVARH